jgi:hypothetical protein
MNYETVKHVKLCHLFCLDVGGDKLSDLYSILFLINLWAPKHSDTSTAYIFLNYKPFEENKFHDNINLKANDDFINPKPMDYQWA